MAEYLSKQSGKKKKHSGEALLKQGGDWMQRIHAAGKSEHTWQKNAEAAEKAYAADTLVEGGKIYDFNVLHSNVETIVPAIYNSTPIPDIRRRFVSATGEPPQPPAPAPPQPGPDGQPLPPQPVDPRVMAQFEAAMQAFAAKEAADKAAKDFGDMLERAISHQIDDNKVDAEIESSAQDAFLSGRGIVRLRFEGVYNKVKVKAEGDDEETALADFKEEESEDYGEMKGESVCVEAVSWRDFRMGRAKRWKDVPWVAFRQSVTREEAQLHEDKDLMEAQAAPGDYPGDEQNRNDDIAFWEIWVKHDKTVRFVREYDNKVMRIIEDPLGLSCFFPMPSPVQPITLTGNMTPVCPFSIYKRLADELDLATKRINAIMKGLKVRGVVAGNATAVLKIAELDDNEISVISDIESLAQTGGIDKAVMWWPVEQSIKVLQQLYQQRDQIKQAIYEITGISDIVRGASNANETLGAQQIKTQWGSLRIQKMQKLIERQVRDVFVIMAEIITKNFSPKTLQQMTGMEITPAMQQLMNEPLTASYRVDVESNSTVRADLTVQKQEMTEFMQGTGGFFQVMEPIIEKNPALAAPVGEIYASFARVFKLGKQAEDAIDTMIKGSKDMAKQAANAEQKPSPEEMKAQADIARADAQAKAKEQEHVMQMQAKGADAQAQKLLKDAEMQAKAQAFEQDRQWKAAEHKERMINIQLERDRAAFEAKRKDDDYNRERDRSEQERIFAHGADTEGNPLPDLPEIVANMSKAIESQGESLEALALALTAPKQMTTPDGRVYTAQTVVPMRAKQEADNIVEMTGT